MARGANPFYHAQDANLGAAIGAMLGEGLFGNPQAAQAQAEARANIAYREAQARASNADAELTTEKRRGVIHQNDASADLPTLIASMFNQPSPMAGPAPVAAPGGAPQAFDPAAFRAGLPAVVAALAQMKGDGVDMGDVMGALGGFTGNDEIARGALIAQGHTPGEDFAVNAGRADAISARDAGEDLNKAVTVENIQSGDRRYATDTQASTTRRGQNITATTQRRGQDIASDDRRYGVDSKGYDRAGAVAVGNTLGRVTSTVRTAAHNKEVGGVKNSYHLDTRGGRGIDIARKPGVSHSQVVAAYKAQGYTILEELDEGDHSHLALAGGPNAGKGKPGKAPPQVSKADAEIVDKELKGVIAEAGLSLSDQATRMLRSRALSEFQKSGNPVEAASRALASARAEARNGGGAKPQAPAKPAAQGGKPDAESLRREALAAISKGAPAALVRQRFKQKTGQNL